MCTRRNHRRASRLFIVAVVYGVAGLAAYWPVWPGDPNRLPTCACGDPVLFVWSLRWTAFAVTHGHNPWLTHHIDYPTTVNLAQNTTVPLLGLIGLPLTVTIGAVSTFNLFMWLAFPLSAVAAFVLLRRWVQSTLAAFVGGLLYGFSPYMVNQGVGHLQLIFVPFPPIILLLLDELLVRQRRRPVRVGLLLGLVLALEYLTSPEVFGSTCVVAAVGIVVLAAARPQQVRRRAAHAVTGAAAAVFVCTALIGYPVWLQIAGPNVISGSAHGTYPFPADLLGSIVPTRYQLVAPSRLVAISDRFILGDVVEDGSYLGIPLLIVLAAVVVWRWRNALVRFAVVMAAVATVISLGPTLTVDAHPTGIALPVALLDYLPLFKSFIDARFALYTSLFAAIILAVGVDQWQMPAGRHATARRRRGRSPWCNTLLVGVLGIALVSLVPNWPYPSYPTDIPSFASSVASHLIQTNSTVMTYPYGYEGGDQAMLWQAASSMDFRLLGGYAIVPGLGRVASFNSIPRYMASVPATLIADYEGTSASAVVAGSTQATPPQVRAFAEHYHVTTVLFDRMGNFSGKALTLLSSAFGSPRRIGGLDVWTVSQS